MPQTFFHQDFLKMINLELFNEYLISKDFMPIETDPEKDDHLKLVISYVDNLPPDERNAILNDFISTRELASDGGVKAVFTLNKDEAFVNKLASQNNNTCRALCCLIYHPKLFDKAIRLKQLVGTSNFHTRINLRKVTSTEVKSKLKDFELELIAFLQSKEGRGKNCQIDLYDFGDRICFFAYPEDHPKTQKLYEDNKLRSRVSSPSFEIIFVYYPEEGKLEISTKMRAKKRQRLFDIFNSTVLGDLEPVPSNQQVLNLDHLLDEDFRFTLDPEDEIEKVFLSQIRLNDKYSPKKRVAIYLDEGENTNSMITKLKNHKLLGESHQANTVSQATIKFLFKQFGRSNRVTAMLTNPDRNTLNETASNQLAKKCIQKWGLINDGDLTTP